jgi:hypothetical protein
MFNSARFPVDEVREVVNVQIAQETFLPWMKSLASWLTTKFGVKLRTISQVIGP